MDCCCDVILGYQLKSTTSTHLKKKKNTLNSKTDNLLAVALCLLFDQGEKFITFLKLIAFLRLIAFAKENTSLKVERLLPLFQRLPS